MLQIKTHAHFARETDGSRLTFQIIDQYGQALKVEADRLAGLLQDRKCELMITVHEDEKRINWGE